MRQRLFMLIALGLLLAQATFVVSLIPCDACSFDECDDACAPRCESCLCCSMARIDVPTEPGVRALALVGSVLASPIVPRRPADPQDIFHVPKPSLS